MDAKKRKRLEAAGWKTGTVQELLGLTDAEAAYVELRLALSRLLRALREGKGVTQMQLAKLIGSSQSRVAKMEAADVTVSLDLLLRGILAVGGSPQEVGRFLTKTCRRAA